MNIKKIEQIEGKVKKLIHAHDRLLTEHGKLKEEYRKIIEDHAVQKKAISEFSEKNKLHTLAEKINQPHQNSKEIKLMINDYIREIDKCLSLLNR
jgi:predicted component of type VI protein secretion system